jgi:hypothetical protein
MSSFCKYENIKCPICFKNINTICDNDCGTIYCCKQEFHYQNNIIVLGHQLNCGIDNDNIIDDNIEIL